MGKETYLRVKTFKTVILIIFLKETTITQSSKFFNKTWFLKKYIYKFLVISSMMDRRELLFTDTITQVEMKYHMNSSVDAGASSTIAEAWWQLISHFSSKSNFIKIKILSQNAVKLN